MSGKDASTPVGKWVTEYPRTARVFEEFKIDYCCGGGKSLTEVCKAKQLDADAVLTRLSNMIIEPNDDSQPDWSQVSLTSLCDHIESTHHAFLKTELPRLTQIVEKVAKVHGDNYPELKRVRDAFAELRAELEPHMFKEERILFPAIRQLEQSDSRPQFPFGSVANPIRMMEHEHDIAGNALKRIRENTFDFEVPVHACNTWRVMLNDLPLLESDLHQHIHKENNILFPKAQQLEAKAQ